MPQEETQPISQSSTNEKETVQAGLEEGELYLYRKGTLERVQRDETDTLRRIKIAEEAFNEVLILLLGLRGLMGGFKPGIELICSAVLHHYAQSADAQDVVRRYGAEVFSNHGKTELILFAVLIPRISRQIPKRPFQVCGEWCPQTLPMVSTPIDARAHIPDVVINTKHTSEHPVASCRRHTA